MDPSAVFERRIDFGISWNLYQKHYYYFYIIMNIIYYPLNKEQLGD